MLIDSLDIVYAPARVQRSILNDQASVIGVLADKLALVGWTVTDTYKAICSWVYWAGYPVVDGGTSFPLRVVGCPDNPFLRIGDIYFTLYDPGREIPPASPACIFVGMATSVPAGLTALCGAISTNTNFDATTSLTSPGVYTLLIEAKAPGADYNNVIVSTDGRWAGFPTDNGFTAHGGVTLQSAGTSVYRVTVTFEPNLFGNLRFDFALDTNLDGVAQYRLSVGSGAGQYGPAANGGEFTLIANGYGFALFTLQDDGAFPYIARSLFCMAPAMPADENFADVYGVFILGPGSFRGETHFNNCTITTCLDTHKPATYGGSSGGWPRLLALRSPGVPLLSLAKTPVIMAAYIMFGYDAHSGAAIIGKLWDCAVVSNQAGTSVIIDGQRFLTVSSQSGTNGQTASSLMMCAPVPIQPVTGTCNLFGYGVTRLTGPVFTGLAHLSPITIAGVPYLIDSVTDADHITLTTASAIAAGAIWTVP